MQFGLHLVRRGLISPGEFIDVVERQLASRPPLGALAIETKKLSMRQLFEVLSAQADSRRPLGALAVDMGFLEQADVEQLLGMQCERCLPVHELIVQMGLLTRAEVERERQRYQRAASGDAADERNQATGIAARVQEII